MGKNVAAIAVNKKAGRVAVVGRPNAGKSTLLNQLLHMKVSITSPRPQTTRRLVEVVYEDERGQMVLIDTPGLFMGRGKPVNYYIEEAIKQAEAILYLVDVTRAWGQEEASLWGKVEMAGKPVVVGLNKIDDLKKEKYLAEYRHIFCESERVVDVSALRGTNTPKLLSQLFEVLPIGQRETEADDKPVPILNMSSREYLAEIVREKVYVHLYQELPYLVGVKVEEIKTTEDEVRLIAVLRVPQKKRGLVIGERGKKITEIKRAVKKELEVATDKRVIVSLEVES